jgi:hypothetical protein
MDRGMIFLLWLIVNNGIGGQAVGCGWKRGGGRGCCVRRSDEHLLLLLNTKCIGRNAWGDCWIHSLLDIGIDGTVDSRIVRMSERFLSVETVVGNLFRLGGL